ncbi:nucleotidyltransferase family protein [Paenibacillus oenotherae]|uniref:Nucleotidyltransferase family protein n=1 Tax=Paenibacillus oenotherae TaxID=1435645 RepID=A0ABS7DA33_9BACL|nr:nucleotidyltransferase family protein [Paenibacillus oenotherae]MBW7476740.1 nucleotidyltransferase family protein [Paenibacillus oenotherae]
MEMGIRLDRSCFPKELDLMNAILGMDNDSAGGARAGNLTDIDWSRFLELVGHHRAYPIVYSNCKKLDEPLLPAEVVQALYGDYSRNTFRMLHLTGQLEKAAALFAAHQIPSLVLKGPVLADVLYGDLSMRTSKDLDILIPVSEIEKVHELMLQLGYVADNEHTRIIHDWKTKYHNLSYYHAENGIEIEIHWRLNPEGGEPSFQELWERKQISSLASQPLYTLGQEDLFMYLASHGARHGWFRLRWLTDIDRLLGKGLQWELLLPMLRQYGLEAIGGQTFILLHSLLRTPLNEEMRALASDPFSVRLAGAALAFINGTESPNSSLRYRQYLLSLQTKRGQWSSILRLLHPTINDTRTLSLPRPLYFLYFFLRPFLWFWRQLKHQASS